MNLYFPRLGSFKPVVLRELEVTFEVDNIEELNVLFL